MWASNQVSKSKSNNVHSFSIIQWLAKVCMACVLWASETERVSWFSLSFLCIETGQLFYLLWMWVVGLWSLKSENICDISRYTTNLKRICYVIKLETEASSNIENFLYWLSSTSMIQRRKNLLRWLKNLFMWSDDEPEWRFNVTISNHPCAAVKMGISHPDIDLGNKNSQYSCRISHLIYFDIYVRYRNNIAILFIVKLCSIGKDSTLFYKVFNLFQKLFFNFIWKRNMNEYFS